MEILRSNGVNPRRFVKIVKHVKTRVPFTTLWAPPTIFSNPIYYALGSADDIFESQKTNKMFKNDPTKHPKGSQNLHNHVKIGREFPY